MVRPGIRTGARRGSDLSGAGVSSRPCVATIAFLQTRDPPTFPSHADFDDARMKAFVQDLREALADLDRQRQRPEDIGFRIHDA